MDNDLALLDKWSELWKLASLNLKPCTWLEGIPALSKNSMMGTPLQPTDTSLDDIHSGNNSMMDSLIQSTNRSLDDIHSGKNSMMGTPVQPTDKSLDDIRMSSNDLISKKEIDCGGFGTVYLCCHRDRGLVVLKTVFTGHKQDSYKHDLLQEGIIMSRLNNERIVKLLGVILEDCNYALVIEYMTKGNLLNVLKQTKVPVSIKARFILEIIEGMVYLHSQKVIHKDLKPENILANDGFHIKIADLGVAAFQKWSCLTKEETNRQRNFSKKSGTAKAIGAGTLSYMAPEHLKNINAKANEKSDVYSFAIVIWVILSNEEPYQNAISDVQLSLGVRDGQRPELPEDFQDGLNEAIELMQECWKDAPNERPSFQECEKKFSPVFTEKYKKNITQDMAVLQKSYPEPEAFIQRMASLQVDCDAEPPSIPTRDTPLSLHSSMGLAGGNVDENFFCAAKNEPVEYDEEKHNHILHRKLQEEMNYHVAGSRIENMTNTANPAASSESTNQTSFNNPAAVYPYYPGSVRPFNASHANDQRILEPPSQTYRNVMNSTEIYTSATSNAEYGIPSAYPIEVNPHVTAASGPVAYPYEQYGSPHGFGNFSNNAAKVPVAETEMPDFYPPYGSHQGTTGNNVFPKGSFEYSSLFTPGKLCDSREREKSVNLTISNSRAIQIGNNNYMVVDRESNKNIRHVTPNPNVVQNQPMFDNNSLVSDNQIQLLRENLSKKWKEFARRVGFSEPEIDEIDYDYERDGLKEKVVQMLYRWQMKEGTKNATVGKVVRALHYLDETDLLNKLLTLN
ncbi:receptor-interacting serine/threonine-protein kinase 1 [Gastrophryne carolinensis]